MAGQAAEDVSYPPRAARAWWVPPKPPSDAHSAQPGLPPGARARVVHLSPPSARPPPLDPSLREAPCPTAGEPLCSPKGCTSGHCRPRPGGSLRWPRVPRGRVLGQAPSTPGHMSQAGVSASQHPAPGTAKPAHQAWESQVHSERAQGAICAKPGLPGSQGAPAAHKTRHTHTQRLRRSRTNHTHAHACARVLRRARQRHLEQRSQPCFGHPQWI